MGARKRVRARTISGAEGVLWDWGLERREKPSEDGKMGLVQAVKGFAMRIKGFALYSNSSRKPLKGFKQISHSVIHSFQIGHMGWCVVSGRLAGWDARRPLRKP